MPELPEVQTIVDDLNAVGILGRCIQHVNVFWTRSIATPSAKLFCQHLAGCRVGAIRRRGKYLIFDLCNSRQLLFHLRMTGRLHWASPGLVRSPHEHVIFDFGSQHLRFYDPRKFGRLYLVEDSASILGGLGPEPLEAAFTLKNLSGLLRARRRSLKPLLLDQNVIAGLGNIYVDEALWEARLHPCRIAATLGPGEQQALHRAIRKVLRCGLANRGSTLGSGRANFYSIDGVSGTNRRELKVFRRTGQPCPRCRSPIVRLIIAQRSTHICPKCQSHLDEIAALSKST